MRSAVATVRSNRRARESTLKLAVRRVTTRRADRRSVALLVKLSHRYAQSYLWQKMKRGHLNLDLLGLKLEDLALDCIADLFQRSEDGTFVQLEAYFSTRDWTEMDECELNVALRRLVFSQVNEGLFRRYREADGALAKIIRNIKLAAKSAVTTTLERRRGEQWLVVQSDAQSRASLPTIPVELLEGYLASQLEHPDGIPQAIEAVSALLGCESRFNNAYPVTKLARAVRSAYSHIQHEQTDGDAAGVIPRTDVERGIRRAAGDVRREKSATYVGAGKVSEDVYEAYFFAVSDVLRSEFLSDSKPTESIRDALSEHLPSISKEEYAESHRNVLEYLLKLTRGRLLTHLSEDLARASSTLHARSE